MKKFLFSSLFSLIIIGSIVGYLFLKNEQKRMFDIYFNNPRGNVLTVADQEFLPFLKTFYNILNIKKSDDELKKHHICLSKDQIFKANKKRFVFDQKQLENTLTPYCEQMTVLLNEEPHYIHLYNICNRKKECKKILLYIDKIAFFKNKETYRLTGNKFEKIDFKTVLHEKFNIQETEKILFSIISDVGIGNQLFQHWGGYIYAQKKGLTFFPIKKKEIHFVFDIENPTESMQKIKSIGAFFDYYERLINFEKDTFIFQSNPISVKNFEGFEQYIQENTKFKIPLTGKSKEIADQMKKENAVSIHLRRRDFSTSLWTLSLNEGYYQRAVQYMNKQIKNPHYYVFSDDIAWAKENLKIDGKVTFVDWTTKDYEDLQLMTKTKHNIIANSTFSWWGAFLNPNKEKIVLIPKTGFYNEGWEHMKVDENWIVVQE